MPTVSVLGADFYYERHGQGPALLFAHGLGGNHLVWWQQVPFFRQRYTCITIDHPGFGWSGQPPGERWSFVDCLEGLLDALDLARVSLVGQSMGGKTCLGFALRRPERVAALVMASTMLPLRLPEFGDYQGEVARGRQALAERGITPACGETMAREQPALHFLYTSLSALNSQWHSGNWPPGSERVPWVGRAELVGFTVPTLFAFGQEDAIMPPRVLELAAAAVPGARVVRFPRSGHSVYFERADDWNRAVDGFLSQVLA
jgi:pimeloyl-ACP methyl ester carboxylesterase